MKFWALGCKEEEDSFLNFETGEATLALDSNCLLPTKKMAEEFIQKELSYEFPAGNVQTDFVPVEIEVTVSRENTFTWKRETVVFWDGVEA